MTALCVGDVHIGSGQQYDRLPDQRRSWESVCVTAADLGADILGTGDFFHRNRPSAPEIEAFQSGLRILREGGCRFVSCSGNGVHEGAVIGQPNCLQVACAGFDARALREACVVETRDGPVGFLPWVQYPDARAAQEQLMTIAEDLSSQGARILIGHWALAGGSVPNGTPSLDLGEPVLDSFHLGSLFDVVLFGHIHKRQVVVDDGSSLVAHVGGLCRVNFGESACETGGWSVTHSGHVRGADFYEATPFDVEDRRFLTLRADVRKDTEPTMKALEAIYDQADFVQGSIVRMQWEQRSDQAVDVSQLIAELDLRRAHYIDTLTPVIERAASVRSAGLTEVSDPRDGWKAWSAGQQGTVAPDVLESADEIAMERIGRSAA